jgi:RND superfamily putative drug exporter
VTRHVDERERTSAGPPGREETPSPEGGAEGASRASRLVGGAIVWLRWPLLIVWIVAAVAAYIYLPGTGKLPAAGIYALIPRHTPAFQALHEETSLFGSHLVPQIAVVQRNAGHLSPADQTKIVQTAVRLDEGKLPGFPKGSLAAPLLNTLPLVPAARETSTTAVTYLAFPSRLSSPQQRTLADKYAKLASLPGAKARPTGLIPGTLAEANEISGALRWVEIATIAMIAVVVGLYLRSVLAPILTVFAVILLYLVTSRVVTWIATRLGINLHQEAEPIVVVLLVGVITDYSVFFLSGMRDRILRGQAWRDAARGATIQFLPIIFTAGLLVSVGLASLQVASIGFISALGPGMAIVVFITLLVALTFVPGAMSVLGRYLFWPGIKPSQTRGGVSRDLSARGLRHRIVELVTTRRRAYAVVAVCVVLLCGLGSGLLFARVGLTPIRGLPAGSPPHRAADEAAKGFAAGVIAPTDVMFKAAGIAHTEGKLLRLRRGIAGVPGVAAVVGAAVPGLPKRYDVFRAPTGNGARFLVVFDHSPFSASAISDLQRLQARMPQLLRSAGLAGARAAYAGDTAIARDTQAKIFHDLAVVAATVFAINLLLLVIFLRALVAPLYLLASSALALAATFGMTTYVFQGIFGYGALTYFVPLAAGVLLVAFGSDYNLFIVGRIWQESRERRTSEAIEIAAPRASRAISVAGLSLALSFGMLAIVRLRSFRELAFAVGFGVLIDTFVVRTLLIPSLIEIFGRRSWWPSRRD